MNYYIPKPIQTPANDALEIMEFSPYQKHQKIRENNAIIVVFYAILCNVAKIQCFLFKNHLKEIIEHVSLGKNLGLTACVGGG